MPSNINLVIKPHARVDVCRWAVGILLFEMLAGFPPFYDDNPFLIYQRVLAGRMDFPFHIDRDAKVSMVGHECPAASMSWHKATDGVCQGTWSAQQARHFSLCTATCVA